QPAWLPRRPRDESRKPDPLRPAPDGQRRGALRRRSVRRARRAGRLCDPRIPLRAGPSPGFRPHLARGLAYRPRTAGAGGRGPAPASPGAGASVTSATPPGTVPVFTVSGCATSQSEVALTLERLRLIDGVASVSLKSSNQSSSGQGSGTGGVCPPNDPAYAMTIEFAPLPASAAAAKPSATPVSNQGAAR